MNMIAIWLLAYVPSAVFAVTGAYLVVEARYWPAFFLILATALFQPGSTQQ